MRRCPITLREIADGEDYSREGLSLLSPKLSSLLPLEYSAEEQRIEAVKRAPKMSIQGVQPKLSARLKVQEARFEVVDVKGIFILKPQHALYSAVPENEDLTMRLAGAVGINCPLHGLLWAKDRSLTYFIKRFDRYSRICKRAQEDFAQLSGRTRETKYDSSIEQVIAIVDRYCTFPLVEKRKLLTLLLFSFLSGNEDMHLKNFSLLSIDEKVILSPAYDLLNTTIAVPGTTEEMALPLRGKKHHLTKNDFLKYLAQERLGLPGKVVAEVIERFRNTQDTWRDLIDRSFLPKDQKQRYVEIVSERVSRLLY